MSTLNHTQISGSVGGTASAFPDGFKALGLVCARPEEKKTLSKPRDWSTCLHLGVSQFDTCTAK